MNKKWKIKLPLSNLTPDGKVTRAQAIHDQLPKSTYITVGNLPLTLVQLQKGIDDLHTTIIATGNGIAGAVSNMHEKEKLLEGIVKLLAAYIEMVANTQPDPKTVIESTGFTAANYGGTTPVAELTLTAAGNGAVDVQVPRKAGEVAFVYEYSTDAGITWQEFITTKLSKVQLTGQPLASTVYMRFAPIAKTKGAYSQPKSVIVV